MKKTIEDLKRGNRMRGKYFFSPDTMRFFDSRIETDIIGGCFFVTSEMAPEQPRRFSIRQCDWETYEVDTVEKFQEFESKEDAVEKIYSIIEHKA